MSSTSTSTLQDLLIWLWADQRQLSLLLLLGLAALIDWRSYRIPNSISLGGTGAVLLCTALWPQSALGGMGSLGFWTALGGWALGLGLFLPFYALGVMGAGDVKLMAMVGAFLGYPAVGLAVLFVFITGGLAVLAFTWVHQAWSPLLHNLKVVLTPGNWPPQAGVSPEAMSWRGAPSIGRLPYGVSIALGTTAFVLSRQLGWV